MKQLIGIMLLLIFTGMGLCDDRQPVLCTPEQIIIEKDLYRIDIEPIRIPYAEGWGPKSFKIRILSINISFQNII